MQKTATISRVKLIRLAFAALCGFGVATGAVSLARADCVKDVASNDVLWVRAQANPHANKVGSIPWDGCDVNVAQCVNSGWCRVSYHGVTGWVNARRYLSRATGAPAPSGGGGNTSVTQQQLQQKNIIINVFARDGSLSNSISLSG